MIELNKINNPALTKTNAVLFCRLETKNKKKRKIMKSVNYGYEERNKTENDVKGFHYSPTAGEV